MIRFFRTRTGIALLAALAIIGIATAAKYRAGADQEKSPALAIEKAIESSLDKDSDKDGLKDWEESLYKTQSANPDTDGDGTEDGEEVRLGRNPLVSGVDISAPDDLATTTEFSYTATDRFSQEIFKEYIAAKQSGQEITPELTDRIAEAVLSRDYSDFKPFYGVSDIRIRENATPSYLRTYGNSLALALSLPPAADEPESLIFPKLGQESVEGYRADLEAHKARYQKMLGNVLALAAPESAAQSHANLANALSIFIDAIDGALALEEDPIGSLVKIGRYPNGMDLLDAALIGIKKSFVDGGVKFSPAESGYMLTR